jgi:hypothetical protein
MSIFVSADLRPPQKFAHPGSDVASTLKERKVIPSLVLMLRDVNTRASGPETFLPCSSA